jgi:hypothetical protein
MSHLPFLHICGAPLAFQLHNQPIQVILTCKKPSGPFSRELSNAMQKKKKKKKKKKNQLASDS